MAIASWRFRRTFGNAMMKLEAGESQKYIGQYNWVMRKVKDAMDAAGMWYVDLEMQKYDIGLPVTAVNLDDFEPDESLYIEQMIEPVIMGDGGLKNYGKVMLGRIEK